METSSGNAIVVPDSPSDSSISLDKKRKKLVLHHHSRLLKGKEPVTLRAVSRANEIDVKMLICADNTTSSHKKYSKGSGRVTQTSNRCSDVILIDDAPGSVLVASNNTAGVEKHERKSKALSLTTRTTLASFYDSLKKLNPTQKAEVRDTGFGNILELKVKELPGRMAYWALNGNVLFMFKDLELCRFDLVSL
ncbi:uncharacterized protein LOC131003787 isoform X2 [Salvia miltiorrhiza]|uniref:uncharacterized protein LOC131003787 isoform X2 n=1 Tax=Salvia miltiorrhiza TaxID=226208 RepID=UPI0025AC4BD8|nr:uncharacterized protein LOC131003787 isoform X2 [Salvia miltiorrhiza]